MGAKRKAPLKQGRAEDGRYIHSRLIYDIHRPFLQPDGAGGLWELKDEGCGASPEPTSVNFATRGEDRKEPVADSRGEVREGLGLQVGPHLMVTGFLGGAQVKIILDSGAGVSIVGGKFIKLYKDIFGYPPHTIPITLHVSGINSSAGLRANAMTSFPLRFGHRLGVHRVSAVVVPEWEGEVLLGWRTLKTLGINFIQDEGGIPKKVRFTRLGVECELLEPYPEKVIGEVRNIINMITTKLDEEQSRSKQGEKKNIRRSKKGGSPVPNSLTGEGRGPIERKIWWRAQCRKRWLRYKEREAKEARREIEMDTAECLGAYIGEQDLSDGWTLSDEASGRLTQLEWSQPTLLAGRHAGRAVMDFIRKGKEGTILFPWVEPTAGHIMEALDRTDSIPLLIPSIHMYRKWGRTITKDQWIAVKVTTPEKAREWRAKTRQFFLESDLAREAESAGKIAQTFSNQPENVEIDPSGSDPAAKLYRAIKDTVLGESQPFSSLALQQEDPEEEEINWKALGPPDPESKGTPKIHGSRTTLGEYLRKKTDVFRPALLDLCWKYRELFDEIQPGSVKGHEHRIDLDTVKDLKARIYPLRGDSQIGAAREEITRLLKEGMIKEIKASEYQAPIVMAPKKSADGKKKWRFCCDFRLLNEHTISDRYPMPSLETQLDVGRAKYFTKLDLASAFWQIPIAREDQHKTTFHFEGKSYKWVVMPFGLRNAPPTFQRLVDKVLSGLIGKGVYAYIDDILIFTETLEEHMVKVKEVLERLRIAGLKISLDKSEWVKKEVQYLGYIIGEGVLKMDPSKTEDILKIPIPPDTFQGGR